MLIAMSASGEVARTLEAAELARGCGAHTLAITTQAASALAGAAEGRPALSPAEGGGGGTAGVGRAPGRRAGTRPAHCLPGKRAGVRIGDVRRSQDH